MRQTQNRKIFDYRVMIVKAKSEKKKTNRAARIDNIDYK